VSGFFPAGGSGVGGGGLTLLGSATLVSPASSLTLTPAVIPSGLSALLWLYEVCQSTKASSPDTMNIRINGDAGATNYGQSQLGGSSGGGGFASFWQVQIPGTASAINSNGAGTLLMTNYAGVANDVTVIGQCAGRIGNGGVASDLLTPPTWSGIWSGTKPVTSLGLTLVSGPNFAAGLKLSCYGIA
jgi:hypothetical protein